MTAEEFRAEGWHCVCEGEIPPGSRTVEFAREAVVYRQPPWFGRWADFRPEFNVAGLWWREV